MKMIEEGVEDQKEHNGGQWVTLETSSMERKFRTLSLRTHPLSLEYRFWT